MYAVNIKEKIKIDQTKPNYLIQLDLDQNIKVVAYSKSILESKEKVFFIARENKNKYLYIIKDNMKGTTVDLSHFEGTFVDANKLVMRCELSTKNRKALQRELSFANPSVLGLSNSFGFGDRLGLSNPGHLRALRRSKFKPVLAQQSIRELMRTNRTPDEVMDAAVWAVVQEGYKEGFGADADHLKTTDDIDLMVKAGFTMFTFDPSEHVDNEADNYDEETLLEMLAALPWKLLEDSFPDAEQRYLSKAIKISESLIISPNEIELLRAYSKYGKAIAHIKNLYKYIQENYSTLELEIEVSVDETESVTSPFEHFFFSNELIRLGVKFISLAPRFIGDFEKGIDYKGDLKAFEEEYKKHLAITEYFGSYKISLHSGSDKFSVYHIIGKLKSGKTHVKTAGTSYLEALKTAAIKQPHLFREILDYSRNLYEHEKKTYHVSADINKVQPSVKYSNEELLKLFLSDDARQILHVTFGRVLTDKDDKGNYIFKNRILDCLRENEDTHYDLLIEHFRKHLEPFE